MHRGVSRRTRGHAVRLAFAVMHLATCAALGCANEVRTLVVTISEACYGNAGSNCRRLLNSAHGPLTIDLLHALS